MFIAALFTMTKTWSIDRWMDKEDVVYTHTHTMEYYSAIKKWIFAICSNMDGLGGHCAKWNKSDRER